MPEEPNRPAAAAECRPARPVSQLLPEAWQEEAEPHPAAALAEEEKERFPQEPEPLPC